jgi:hypothetical protein
MRKLVQTLLLAVLCLSQFSCATQALYRDSSVNGTEKIRSFLVTEDRHTLVIAGESHHFIFPLGEPLRSVLMWNGRDKLEPTFRNFIVDNNQTITGEYTLRADLARLSAQDQQFLRQKGFQVSGNGLEYSSSIRGTRYLASHVKLPQTAYFPHPYMINIQQPESDFDKAAKIAVTPVTLAVDGVGVLLGGLLLSPVGLMLLM